MKKLVVFTIISMLLFSCKTEPQRTDYIINGSAKGVYNGVRSYLKVKEKNGREKVIDTAIIFDEKFSFNGKVDYPTLSVITINSVNGRLNLMLENSLIDVDIDISKISESKITGSNSQNDFEAYDKDYSAIKDRTKSLMTLARNNKSTQSKTKKDSINKLLEINKKKLLTYPIDFIKNNTSSFYSLSLIEQQLTKKNANIEDYIEAFENLDTHLKTSPKGVDIKQNLDSKLVEFQKTAQLQIGKVAPNFNAPQPNGDILSLNDIKGKVTIVDFWAAWCGPCRRENPNVVKIYNKYHHQGLEIVGISLDGSRTQKNPKQAWLNAIEKDKLTWHHVSNLNYFNGAVAKLYNITSIPATYILDKDGKIVAKNLRGKALELKVAELLQN